MNVRLEIDQRFAKIGLKEVPPETSIEQKSAEIDLQQLDGKLEIEEKPVKIEIDQKKARAALNHKHYKIYSRDIVKKAHQTALKAIGEYAKQGDQLARIEKNSKPLIDQAEKNAYGGKKELSLKWKRGPEYKVDPGQLDINFNVQDLDGINLDTELGGTQVDLKWGRVEVYQRQLPELEIRAVNERV